MTVLPVVALLVCLTLAPGESALTITPINRTQPSSMSDVVSVFGFVSCRIEADFPLNHTSVKSRWILPDGTILQVNQNYDKYFVNQGDSAGGYETLLFIKRLSYSDADTYTCEVRDGRDPDTPGPWMTFQVTLQLLVELTVDEPDVTTFDNVTKISLSCEMSLYLHPNADLQWFREGQLITTDNERHTITYTNGSKLGQFGETEIGPSRISTLVISEPQLSDSANYTCAIRNTEHSQDIQLTVESAAALFQVICTAELLADRSCINITCEVAEGSQSIVGVDFLINGESEGSGSLPHCIPFSSLSDGANEITLQLHGSEGSQGSVTFTLERPTATPTPPPQFDVECSVDLFNATSIHVDCMPAEGSDEISGVQSFLIGGVDQGSASLPLSIRLSSLAPGGDDVDLQLISVGGLQASLRLRLTGFLASSDRACLVRVVRNNLRSIESLIIYCWGYVNYNYSYNDDAFIYGTEFPIVVSGDDLVSGRNTFVFQATGEDGIQRELRGSFDNARTDLNVTCIRSAVPGHEIINCTSTNPLVSVVCAYDGGGPEVCSFPLVLGIERFGTDSHVVLVTATDGFGQTATMEFVFQLAGRPNVNDSVVADPQFTVTLPDGSGHSLCYEIHGDAGKYFNLISDTCLSVNAHFTAMSPIRNRMSSIGIHAVPDDSSTCVDIQINYTCSAVVGGNSTGDLTVIGGIRLRRHGNRWRVSVPNCERPSTVMWVTCMEQRLRFDVTRGSNLHPTSHGLLGQFWNIPISVTKVNGNSYVEIYNSGHESYRRFPAQFNDLVWDRSDEGCYYAGDSQGASEKSRDPKQSVIEGVYTQYTTDGLFDTDFRYEKFDDARCLL